MLKTCSYSGLLYYAMFMPQRLLEDKRRVCGDMRKRERDYLKKLEETAEKLQVTDKIKTVIIIAEVCNCLHIVVLCVHCFMYRNFLYVYFIHFHSN